MSKTETIGKRILLLRVALDPLDDSLAATVSATDIFPTLSEEWTAAQSDVLDGISTELRADTTGLDRIDAIVLARQVSDLRDRLDMRLWGTFVSGYDHSPLGRSKQAISSLPINTRGERDRILSLVNSIGPYLESCTDQTLASCQAGRPPTKTSIDIASHSWQSVISSDGAALLPPNAPPNLLEAATAAFNVSGRDAAAAYLNALTGPVASGSRSDASPGLCHIAGGDGDYYRLVNSNTDDFGSPEQLHELGREQVEHLHERLRALRGKGGRGQSIKELLVRTSSPPGFSSYEECKKYIALQIRRAAAGSAAAFTTSIPTGPAIEEIDEQNRNTSPTAYYLPGSSPAQTGRLLLNPQALTGTSAASLEPLIYHEAIPGHHLQFSAAQTVHMPLHRKTAWFNTFVEGWGLYAEELAEELGLYTSDDALAASLGLQLFRSARLVVDTGLHLRGWTVQQAEQYLQEKAGVDANTARREILRYIEYPAQALSYATGKAHIISLRHRQEQRLGSFFNLAHFHSDILRQGIVPFSVFGQNFSWSTEQIEPTSNVQNSPKAGSQ